jgi:methyl-accepting chemotaxis protein
VKIVKWISDLSIRNKIFLIIVVTIIGVAIFATWAVISSSSIQNEQTRMLESAITAEETILNADRDLYQAYTAVQELVMKDNTKEEIDEKIAFFNDNIKTAKERVLAARNEMDATKKEWIEFKGAVSNLTAFEIFEKVNPGIDEWVKLSTLSIDNKVFDKGWEDAFNQPREHLDEITELLSEALEENKAKYSRERTFVITNISIGLLIGLVLISLFGHTVIKNISKPLVSVVEMVEEFEKGHLEKRLNLSRKDEIGQLANIMDKYADDLQKYIVSSMDKIAEGNFDFEVLIKDDKDEIGPALKKTTESIKGLVYEVNTLTSASIEGKLQVRGNAEKFKGLYRDIILGINKTLDVTIEPINEATSVLAEVEKGNLQVSVKGDYKGEHAIIKDALNKTIINLKTYISEISNVLNQMSDGNLDIIVDKEFKGDFIEIKNSLNNILAVFNDVLNKMKEAALQVYAGSKQIADSSQMLSQSTTEQASSVEELTAVMNGIAEQTERNALNAKEASELTTEVKEDAVDGNEQMKEMLRSMDEISSASTNISKIIKVIDEIAFQTNILALNAAVEAARAGQHGKGFAVVAEEVRNLAGRSAESAKETAVLIERTVKKTESGMSIAKVTAEALSKIVNGVSKVTDIVSEIATSSNDQATGISQVNQGVLQISQVVQTNSATSQQSAASSQELTSQADTLNGMVSRFRVRKNGHKKSGYEGIDNDILGLLEDVSENNKVNPKKISLNREDISLGDMDFGKY